MIHTDWWRTIGNVKNVVEIASCRDLAAQAAVRRSGRERRERRVEPCLPAHRSRARLPEVVGSTAWARTALSLDDPKIDSMTVPTIASSTGWRPRPAPTVREYETFPLENRLANRLHATARRAQKRLAVPSVLDRTRNGLKAAGVVGIVAAPGVTLEILPKIDGEDGAVRKALVSMLSVAWGLRVADGEIAGLDTQRSDLLEVLVGLFANRLLVTARRGLPRRYVGFEADLKLLRGRLNVVRQVTALAARPDVLACRFEELSEDTPLNRVLKAAVQRLGRATRSAANARILRELAARLERVGHSPAPLKEPVRLDRTNTAYHDLHRLARLLLSGDWQSTTSGEALGFSLLFPMAELFEQFVGKLLQRSAAWPVRLQDRRHSALLDDAKPLFELRPDAVIQAPAGPIVLDTKWKRLDGKDDGKLGVAQGDIYQMLVYGQAYGAERLVLLYPWLPGLAKGVNRSWHVQSTRTRLDIATVDVGEPSSVARTLHEIVRAV